MSISSVVIESAVEKEATATPPVAATSFEALPVDIDATTPPAAAANVDAVPSITAEAAAPPQLLPSFLTLSAVGESLNKLALELATVEESPPPDVLSEELLEPFAIKSIDALDENAVADVRHKNIESRALESEPATAMSTPQEDVISEPMSQLSPVDASTSLTLTTSQDCTVAPPPTPSPLVQSIASWAHSLAQVTIDSLISDGNGSDAAPLGARMDDEEESSPQPREAPQPAGGAAPSAQATAPSFARESLESGARLYAGAGRILVDLASVTKTQVPTLDITYQCHTRRANE